MLNLPRPQLFLLTIPRHHCPLRAACWSREVQQSLQVTQEKGREDKLEEVARSHFLLVLARL